MKVEKKKNALDGLVSKFGPCIGRGFEADDQYTRVYSTGIEDFDVATGIGGLPQGKIVEMWGVESGGKSALMLHMIGSIQKDLKKPCVYCDLEQATPPTWMRTLGIQRKRLVRVKGLPENAEGVPSGERFFDLLYALIDQDRYAAIVVDSIAVVTPARVVAGDVEDKEIPGLQARLVQHGLAKITPRLNKTGTVLVFINQLRSKVGVLWGSNEDQPCGRALKHWKALSVRVSRAGGDRIPNAHAVKIKVVKNKFAAPGGEAEVILNYKTGIDVVSGVLRAALARGIIEGDRRKLTLLGKSFQGRERLKQALKEDPAFLQEVRKVLREKPHVETEQKPDAADVSGLSDG